MSEQVSSQIDDGALVRAFLKATEELSQPEAARAVDGVTQDDMSRWRRGDWKRLSAKKRRAVQDYLDRVGAGKGSAEKVEDGVGENPNHDPSLDGAVAPTYRDLLAQMERILAASDMTASEKSELLGKVTSGMRIAGLLAEGELSRERIRALADEREVARDRQSIIGREGEWGRERAARMERQAGAAPPQGLTTEELMDLKAAEGAVADTPPLEEEVRRTG